MSTVIEDRLAAALNARAELVQPEALLHSAPPAPVYTPVWRRPAVVALVAAAVAAAVVVPLVLRSNHTSDNPLPSNRIPTPVHALSGDVDGDGRPDRITEDNHTITVTLAAHPESAVTMSERHIQGLIGIADVGGAGQGVLYASSGTTTRGLSWSAAEVRNGQLHVVPVSGGPPGRNPGTSIGSVLGVIPGQSISWITPRGVPTSGLLDPAQEGAQKLTVRVAHFTPAHGLLVMSTTVDWCWDKATQGLPAPCPRGVTDAYDPGPHGSLPTLLPKQQPEFILPGQTWRNASTSLKLVKALPHTSSTFTQTYDVTGTIDGHRVSAFGGYSMPQLYKMFVDLGHGVRGLAVQDMSKATWHLLGLGPSGLHRLEAPDPSHGADGHEYLHPGTEGVFVDGKPVSAETWIGPDGQVFTRVETSHVGRFETYLWQVTDASATHLVPVDLGTVCIDDFQGSYGTCTR
jgi:hypothetical protein